MLCLFLHGKAWMDGIARVIVILSVGRVELTREFRICSLLPLRASPRFEIWDQLVWLTAVRRTNLNRPNVQLRGLTDHRLKLPVQERSV
jgi:hypothetical protein